MFWMFTFLLLFNIVVGLLSWLAMRRVLAHMQANPEAARLIAEHVITPLLTGKASASHVSVANELPPQRTKGTII